MAAAPSLASRVVVLIASVLVLAMFLISSVYKMRDQSGYVDILRKTTALPLSVCRALIAGATLLQCVAPLIILAVQVADFGVDVHPWLRRLAMLSVLGLIVFTVIATVLFKLPQVRKGGKPWPLLSNVSVTGGLLLLLHQQAAA